MTLPSIIWGSPQWLAGAALAAGAALILLLWSYGRAQTSRSVKVAGVLLKAIGFAALTFSLVEPLLTGTRPRRGANAFVILADDSRSLKIHDGDGQGPGRSESGGPPTRGDWVRNLLANGSTWKTRLGQDFDVRQYAFDSHLRAVDGFDVLTFDGSSSALDTSLAALAKRFRGLPLAGVLLVTDGNKTDTGALDWKSLPPIYPVIPPASGVAKDVGIANVSISQTNFESAPVVVRADVTTVGFKGRSIVCAVTDEAGRDVERLEAAATDDDDPLHFRFQFQPEKRGVSIYHVRAFAAAEEKAMPPIPTATTANPRPDAEPSSEQTLDNNSRLVVVDQGSGPYRVLYVSGRPNWEFKFLRRALADDEQLDLVGLIRIAKRQPKFDFRSARTSNAAPLFDGFENPDADTAERVDQPVLVRLGTRDEVELRDGFPKTADELYQYHAIVLDDLEAEFFTQDQLGLLRNFVSQRGGGLLMLGGPDSFADGKYDRTPVAELLPIYLNRSAASAADDAPTNDHQLVLTREGWLQPWVRTRKTEEEERLRLATMPAFHTLSQVGAVKPAAVVLSQVQSAATGKVAPALVAQPFGKGRVAALLIGDLWRWGMRRTDPAGTGTGTSTETATAGESAGVSDLERSWRQTVRWLVGDVPDRVEVVVAPKSDSTAPAVTLTCRVRDPEYRPLDNAKVAFKVKRPGGDELTLEAEPDRREAGAYTASYVAREPGAYRVAAAATAPDGSAVGEKEAGWAAQPAADEFARLQPDRDGLAAIAAKTNGEVVDGARLDAFVAGLAGRDAPITEPWTSPLWHQPLYFLIAIACLTAEWGLRRVNGLA